MARLVLAATLSANYGIYGPAFELLEHVPREPGGEEYLDSEKYELRDWDLDARRQPRRRSSRRVNAARRDNPALQRDRRPRLPSDRQRRDDLLRARVDAAGENAALVVVNLDPHHTQSGWVTLDLAALGVDAAAAVPGARPADRRAVPLERRAQLRAARPGAVAGARLPGPPARAHRARLRLLSLRDAWMADATTAPSSAPARERPAGGRRALVQGRDHLPAARQGVLRLQRRRHRRLSGASPRSSTTSRISASTRSGCCRSTRRRCATTATTSPTTATCTRPTARAPTSSSSCARRIAASCASSPSSSINHTSDQHPWFQAARRAPKGSPKRNYYVWSDDPDKYAGTRIIFTDTEKSNWAWDDGRQGVLLASLLQPSAGPQLRQSAGR